MTTWPQILRKTTEFHLQHNNKPRRQQFIMKNNNKLEIDSSNLATIQSRSTDADTNL